MARVEGSTRGCRLAAESIRVPVRRVSLLHCGFDHRPGNDTSSAVNPMTLSLATGRASHGSRRTPISRMITISFIVAG